MPSPETVAPSISYDRIRAVEWLDGNIRLIDQRLLPGRFEYLSLKTLADAVHAIRDMAVRGAPAIGITAAYAVVLAARDHYTQSPGNWQATLAPDLQLLAEARPTAVNLRWAVERMRAVAGKLSGDPVPALLAEAQRIHAEDIAANHRMGELGAALIELGSGVLTHSARRGLCALPVRASEPTSCAWGFHRETRNSSHQWQLERGVHAASPFDCLIPAEIHCRADVEAG
jgi:methylthioribose-1-phosphate isomerase